MFLIEDRKPWGKGQVNVLVPVRIIESEGRKGPGRPKTGILLPSGQRVVLQGKAGRANSGVTTFHLHTSNNVSFRRKSLLFSDVAQ